MSNYETLVSDNWKIIIQFYQQDNGLIKVDKIMSSFCEKFFRLVFKKNESGVKRR